MPKAKKKFIDKKSAVTFHLVHRSQQDPLITDETAPQHVLVQSEAPPPKPTAPTTTTKKSAEKIAELKKFGIFFDDDYDYLQHLRVPGTEEVIWEYVEPPNRNKNDLSKIEESPTIAGLQLPSSVFASEFEEDEGLLRKAAPRTGPRIDWDPDIVAALDDDFDYENPNNQLDDDFFQYATGNAEIVKNDGEIDDNDNEDSDIDSNFDGDDDDDEDGEENDHLGPLKNYDNDDKKSRFTEYSMSSSVIRRNEQLQLLDERFEKFYENYDDSEIGPLDCEEIEGHVEMNSQLLEQCMVEFKHDEQLNEYNKEWDTERLKKYENDEESSAEEEELIEIDDNNKKWDCQSILSTYSNIYNHPKLIEMPSKSRKHNNLANNKDSPIEINKKTGIPTNVFHNDQLTTKSLAKFMNQQTKKMNGDKNDDDDDDDDDDDTENGDDDFNGGIDRDDAETVKTMLSVLSLRPKDETSEDRRERKRLIKQFRSERRLERKANVLAYKDLKKQTDRNEINKRQNLQGKGIV